jgi:hypothetical protein
MSTAPFEADAPPDPFAAASRLWWMVPLAVFALLIILSLVLGNVPDPPGFGTSYDASDAGFRAAYLLLEDLGYPVERSRRVGGGGVRWVLFPGDATAKDAASLDDWVQRGGVALLAVTDDEFAKGMGITLTVSNEDKPAAPTPAPAKGLPPRAKQMMPTKTDAATVVAAEAPDVRRLAAGPLRVEWPGQTGRPWGTIEGRPLVTAYPRGRGELWLLHRPDVLRNQNLRQADNAILACRLADAMLERRPGTLAFDEYVHGLRDRPGVTELLFRPPMTAVTLQALALLALVLWHYIPRFGEVRPLPPPNRRSKEEFLEAMATLLRRKGDRDEAFRTVQFDLQRRIEDELGLPYDTPVDRLVAEAVRRRRVAPEPLTRLLGVAGPPREGPPDTAFVAALRDLEAVGEAFFRGARRQPG